MLQLNNEPIHIFPASSFCIDLIFVSQPTLVMESRVHSSLHQKRHHQIINAKFNLKISYSLLYEREIFAKTIKNIFSKFIPHETILCDDRRPP